jgi:AraC-like DNA-binding protein
MARVKVIAAWPDPGPPPTTAERVFSALDDLFGDPQASTELVGLSAGVGSRRVKAILAEKDTTFRAELLQRRMARARELLADTSFAIRNIAKLCGYTCQSTFAKRFAEQNGGVKPREFRVAQGGSPRVGGTTGAFRKPAQRARAQEQGEVPPAMSRWRSLPGTIDACWAERENERRRARLRGEELPQPRRREYDRYDAFTDSELHSYLAEIEEEFFVDD